jgi:hypothetical protein
MSNDDKYIPDVEQLIQIMDDPRYQRPKHMSDDERRMPGTKPLRDYEVFQQQDFDDTPVKIEQISNLTDSSEFHKEPPDIAKQHVAFLDNAIALATPPDLFGSQKNSNSWVNLQTSASRDKLAEINVWTEANNDHSLSGEINHKVGIVITLLKQRFNNVDAYKEFNKDIGDRIKRLKQKATREKYTTNNIPDDRWFANSSKDNVTLSYAVSNARNIELSCNRLPVSVRFDPFDGTYRIGEMDK